MYAIGAASPATIASIAASNRSTSADDVDSPALTYAVVTGPAHGALVVNPDGSFTYTPAADFNGTDTFTYRASDGTLSSNLATVTLTVNPVNDPPVADNDAYSVNEDGTLNVAAGDGVLDGDTDAEGSALTAALYNVTATQPTAPGYVSVVPDPISGVPSVSNLNFGTGQTIANSVLAPTLNST